VTGKDEARLAGLRGELVACPTAEECAGSLAKALAAHLEQRMASAARVHLALSGGSSGKLLCAALARTTALGAAEWARIHLWMVDERGVPMDDPRSNFGMLCDALVPHVPLPAGNLHPMPVLQPDGAERYQAELREALAERREESEHCLDAVVLGMGADGHTASLFPGTRALDEAERAIVFNDGVKVAPPRPRMTMTYPLLNRARFIAILVTGAGKQETLHKLAEHPDDFRALPVAGVIPAASSRLVWFLDMAAMPRAGRT
jgi:6-phosphogluconolactonase